MHGRDLTRGLKSPETREEPRAVLLEEMGRRSMAATPARFRPTSILYHGDVARWVAIRYGKYKYIRTLLAGEMEEIYDLEADPEELTNLALRPEQRQLLADLRGRCVAELKRTGAPFVDALPATRQMLEQ